MASSFTPATSLIFAAARRAASGTPVNLHSLNAAQNSTLEEELAWVSGDHEAATNLLGELFPAGVALGGEFYAKIARFRAQLGFTKWAEKIGTCVWLISLQSLSQPEVESLLMEFTQTGHSFFTMFHGLTTVVETIALPTGFVVEWFPALVTRLGDDGATAGVWDAIVRYCEMEPAAAIETVEALACSPNSEVNMRIAAEMIGVLRSLTPEVPWMEHLSALEQRLTTSSSPAQRHCCLRSWTATAYRGSLDIENLEALLVRCSSGTGEDVAEGFGVICHICRSPALSEACLSRGLEWLQRQASADLPAQLKYAIAVTIESVAVQCWTLPVQSQTSLGNLLLSILPIAPDHLGTWRKVEDFLIKLLHHDRDAFERMVQAVGEHSAGNLYLLIRSKEVFAELISQMVIHHNDEFVARLVLQSKTGGRELGLSFFERLGMEALPSAILDAVNERELRTALFVFQAIGMHGEVIARFLWAIAPRFETCGLEAKSEFSDELLIQCKNYPSACLDALRRAADPPGTLQDALERADAYFAARKQAYTSPLNAMEIPGYRRMAERKWRIMNREIHDEAHERSIFAPFIKNVEMLYGDRFSSYNDAGLSDATSLREHSFEFEFPHLELIDAEVMALRRWHALQMVKDLEHANVGL